MKKRYSGPGVPQIRDLARSVGGWKRLARMVGENPGTLAHMAAGRRRLTPKVRSALVKLGVIKPRPAPIPWRRVAVWLADNPTALIGALKFQDVDPKRAEEIAARIWE
jgi:hypothetical protein